MFNTFRYDYILIWNHGLIYKDDIIREIRNHNDFEIIKIMSYKPKKINDLVKHVYSCDYAPIWHLLSKTRYLLSTKPEVLFIFFKNNNPDEDYFGDGEFRHIESSTLKRFKEALRDRFNERKCDRRSENHVIHASDNQEQTDYILKYLGIKEGINHLNRKQNKILNIPYHLKKIDRLFIQKVRLSDVYCSILFKGKNNKVKTNTVPLVETPHYRSLVSKNGEYRKYLNEFQGSYLQDNYSQEKFLKLSLELKYLEDEYSNNYVIINQTDSSFFEVLDGVHRTSILRYRGEEEIVAGVCKSGLF